MHPTTSPRIKICCIASEAEADLAIGAGAAAIGLVSAMPSGPGPIDEATIARVAAHVAGRAETFLLTCLTTAGELIAQHRRCGTSTIQLVDDVESGAWQALRAALPRVRLVQVIHVRGPQSVDEAIAAARHVDAILLDSGNPSLAVKELGGTGRVHDWAVSRAIREAVPVPVWLAGGLRTHNVADAIAAVAPYGLDLCSGVRTEGRLDSRKLGDFMSAARGEHATR